MIKNNKINVEKILNSKYFYLIYTICFIFIAFFIYISFAIFNKTSINYAGDGFIQHFSVYVYLKKFYIETIKNILHFKAIKMFDFNVGQGFDILTTLNYYGYGDLLSIIMIFFRNEVIGYNIINILRLYLAGLALIFFVKKKYKCNNLNAIIVGIMYAFSGFSLYAFRTHSYFNNALIFLPLILLGIEDYEESKKKRILILSVALSFCNNFYFAYMETIIAVLYVLYKIIWKVFIDKQNIKDIILEYIKIAFVYLEGILLSAIILLPIIYAFMNNSRSISETTGYPLLLIYNFDYYKELLQSTIYKFEDNKFWTILQINGLMFSTLILLFKNKMDKKYKIATILIAIGIIIPIFGKILNGFSYVTNRWTFCIALLNSIIFLRYLPNIINITKKEIKSITVIYGIYMLLIIVCYIIDMIYGKPIKNILLNLGINVMFYIITVMSLLTIERIRTKKGENETKCAVLVIVMLLSIFMVVVHISLHKGYLANKNVLDEIKVLDINDNGIYRIEKENINLPNYSLINEKGSNSYYYSLISSDVVEYYNSLGVSNLKLKHRLDGLNERVSLYALSDVKYFIGTGKNIPYGFKEIYKEDDNIIYENKNYVPFCYLFNSYITREEFEKMTCVEKEQTLLQTAILENEETNINIKKLDINEIEFSTEKYNINQINKSEQENVLKDKKIIINNKDADLELSFESKEKSEVYLVIDKPNWDSKTEVVGVNVKTDENDKKFFVRKKENNFYFEKDCIIINLGYYEDKINNCILSFDSTGVLNYDSISIVCSDMEIYQKYVNKIKTQQKVNKVDINDNTITIDINANESGILQFSIPYSKGWKAFVDNEEKDIKKTDIMYMGIEIDKGEHNIELVYETPYLKEGAIISSGIILFLILSKLFGKKYIIRFKKLKKQNRHKNIDTYKNQIYNICDETKY